MKTVYIGGEGEIVEKKSRVIATVRPVASEEEAVAFIAEMKKKYWDARHNCSAFVIGDRQELSRCSDDGEPAQTAGRPYRICTTTCWAAEACSGRQVNTAGVRARIAALQTCEDWLFICNELPHRLGLRLALRSFF